MLTSRQKQILEFIQGSLHSRGMAPSLREIGRRFHITYGTVQAHLQALEKKGALSKETSKHRGLVPARWDPGLGIPLLGQVRAGLPILAEENIETHIPVKKAWLKGSPHFALRVKGDSMEGASILDGDVVIVRSQPTAAPGEIVVALREEEAAVKYWRERPEGLFLESANPAYPPMPAEGFTVLGKVVGLLRFFEE
ncbi:MAG: transcriptional repressor LexA [Elusimicrobia bacterium]|nr:transcriptional repressor LexA [Elusimicrobiota bacterium]